MAKRTREDYEELLQDPRAQALVRSITVAEGTSKEADGGLWTTFGYNTIPEEFRGAEHPYYTVPKDQRERVFKRIHMPSLGARRLATASGPIQFTAGTAADLRKAGYLLNWSDPREHYLAALRLADQAGALEPFLAGDMEKAHQGLRKKWDAFNRENWDVSKFAVTVEDSLRAVQENPIVAGQGNTSTPARREAGAMAENKSNVVPEAPWVRSIDERVRQVEQHMKPQFNEIDQRIDDIYTELKDSLKPSTVEPLSTRAYAPGFWTKLGIGLQGEGERVSAGYRASEEDTQNAELRAQQLQVENERATADRQAKLMGDATSAALQKANIYGNILNTAVSEHSADVRAARRDAEPMSARDRFQIAQMFSESQDGQFMDAFIASVHAGQLPVMQGGIIPLDEEQQAMMMQNPGYVPKVPLNTVGGEVDGPLVVAELARQYTLATQSLNRSSLPIDMIEERQEQLASAYQTAWDTIHSHNKKAADELMARGLDVSDNALYGNDPSPESYGHPIYGGAQSYDEAVRIYNSTHDPNQKYPPPVKPSVDAKTGAIFDRMRAEHAAKGFKQMQDFLMFGQPPAQSEALGMPEPGSLTKAATGDGRRRRFIPPNKG